MVWLVVILISFMALPIVSIASTDGSIRATEGPTPPINPGGSGLVQPPALVSGSFDIVVSFSGGLTPSQQAIFTVAETMWESVLTGYQPGVTYTGSLVISAEGTAIDGVGGVLGSAGPDTVLGSGGFLIATTGSMEFDTADLASLETGGTLGDVIAHEMGHVIGFGTLWSSSGVSSPGFQEVYVDGTGQFTGVAALAAYKSEFSQPVATSVPVELGGGSGTADGHWNEVDGGAGLTGITDGDGNDMVFELMTGWLNAPTFLSQTTISSFEDIGYTVVPEPATFSLLMIGGLALVRRRRRA
jgi:hypothetical protein